MRTASFVPCLVVFLLASLLFVARGGAEEGEPDLAARKARTEEARRALAEEEAAFGERVNEAIDRGGAWLRGQQRNDGSFPGFSDDLKPRQYNIMEVGLDALVILTLAHTGSDADDPAVKKCLNFCRGHYSGNASKGSLDLKGSGRLTIYTAATLILALDALYHPDERQPPKVRHDRYGTPVPPKPARCKYPKSVLRWIEELVDFIVRNQVRPAGGWRYPGNPLDAPEAETDLSNTQYALLALDAAEQCNVLAPVETWLAATEHLLREQEQDGLDAPVWIENEAWEPGFDDPPRFVEATKTLARGWAYLPGGVELPTGSMTAAGVTGLAVCKERLWRREKLDAALRARMDKGLLSGLAWLSENFSVEENPTPGGASMWHYYWLYGLERTGAKVGTRWIGRHDWYRTGARYLLSAQQPDGGWKEADGTLRPADATESAITQTCFALLFLRRSTRTPFVPMMPVVTGGG